MSDSGTDGPGAHGPGAHGFSRPGGHEPVGSVGEEAAKLLAALQGWAGEHVADYSRTASGFGSSYISDGSAACRVCPLCQLIAFVRGVNPESMEQLGHAAGSLLNALAGLIDAAHRSDARRESPVEKIHLADDPDDPDDNAGNRPEDPTWG
jgi:hypothetical protein